ncbi:hypothetical protein GQ55_9G458200 [Panicum hallii var. hallii]|uniref:Uncharacterized protein n=1 Tax=Panicum hallii var. hallii TaxID=1504633 RepID=A0A2T7CC26_9POAL|nr:hypothetical protein GQ55_9G458200 [Panicum hallii var. hallii]
MEVEVVRCDQASRLRYSSSRLSVDIVGSWNRIWRSVAVVLGAARVAERDAVDGAQAALGLRDDGGREPGLREPAGPAHHGRRRLLRHGPQRPAPALRRGRPSAPGSTRPSRATAGPGAGGVRARRRRRRRPDWPRTSGSPGAGSAGWPAPARSSWRRPWRWRRAGRRTGGDGG